ncbi:hypothetical protein PT2222_90215 [Paraburkholderia tropica]
MRFFYRQESRRLLLRVREAFSDFLVSGFDADPAFDLDPLALFERLVVLEEVLDLVFQVLGHVVQRLDVRRHRANLVVRHGDQLRVDARLVRHLQHAERARTHDRAGQQRERRDHEHVDGVAVARERLRNETVVDRITHAGADETVDDEHAQILVGFVLDRIALRRNLDDHVEVVRQILAGGDICEAHERSLREGEKSDGSREARGEHAALARGVPVRNRTSQVRSIIANRLRRPDEARMKRLLKTHACAAIGAIMARQAGARARNARRLPVDGLILAVRVFVLRSLPSFHPLFTRRMHGRSEAFHQRRVARARQRRNPRRPRSLHRSTLRATRARQCRRHRRRSAGRARRV